MDKKKKSPVAATGDSQKLNTERASGSNYNNKPGVGQDKLASSGAIPEDTLLHLKALSQGGNPDEVAFTFQTFDDLKERKLPGLAAIIHGTIHECWPQLMEKSRQGAGVFICVNPTDLKGRKAKNIPSIRALWHEDDVGVSDGQFPIPANLKIESSPGKYHRYWLTTSDQLSEFDGIMQRMVADYGSDPDAKDLSRVLRLAGTQHQKDPQHPWTVRIAKQLPGAPYKWDRIKQAFPPVPMTKPDNQSPPGDGVLQQVGKLYAAMLHIPADKRRTWIDVGMGLHHESGGGAEGLKLWNSWSRTCPAKYKPDECSEKWRGFGKKSNNTVITGKTILKLGRDNGWDGGYASDKYGKQYAELEAVRMFDETLKSGDSKLSYRNYNPYDVKPGDIVCTDIGLVEPPKREFLWHGPGEFPHHIVGGVGGQGGSAKSQLFGFQVGLSLANGIDCTGGLFRFSQKKYRVLYLCSEDDRLERDRRIWAIRQHFPGIDASNFYCIPAGGDFSLLTRDKDTGLTTSDGLRSLMELVGKIKPAIVIPDPVSKFSGPANVDSSSADATRFLNTLEDIRDLHGCAVLFVHHVNKASISSKSSGGKPPRSIGGAKNRLEPALSVTAMKGASNLVDNSRYASLMTIVPSSYFPAIGCDNGDNVVAIRVPKSNWGVKMQSIRFLRRTKDGVYLPFEPVGVMDVTDQEFKEEILRFVAELDEPLAARPMFEKYGDGIRLPRPSKGCELVKELIKEGSLKRHKQKLKVV